MEPLGSGNEEKAVRGDFRLIKAIGEHVERTVGPIEGVFHDEHPKVVHVDVHWVAPDENRPFHTLITSGSSSRAMQPPKGAAPFTHMELVMFLPPEWNLAQPSREETWPIQALRALARYPHQHRTWIWGGHTVPLGYESAKPFTAAVLTRPYLLSPESGRLSLDRRRIELLGLIPLYPQELNFVRANGDKALIDRAQQADRFEELFIVSKDREPFA